MKVKRVGWLQSYASNVIPTAGLSMIKRNNSALSENFMDGSPASRKSQSTIETGKKKKKKKE